jgi:hypothetical protein
MSVTSGQAAIQNLASSFKDAFPGSIAVIGNPAATEKFVASLAGAASKGHDHAVAQADKGYAVFKEQAVQLTPN